MSYITIADVRDDLMDRTADDHLVLGELAFTDEDIEWAMKWCARKYNSIRPVFMTIHWEALPSDTVTFFDGIALALYRRKLGNVSLNDFDYNAGSMSANVKSNLLRNLGALVQRLNQEFIEAVTSIKITANANQAWGQIG